MSKSTTVGQGVQNQIPGEEILWKINEQGGGPICMGSIQRSLAISTPSKRAIFQKNLATWVGKKMVKIETMTTNAVGKYKTTRPLGCSLQSGWEKKLKKLKNEREALLKSACPITQS